MLTFIELSSGWKNDTFRNSIDPLSFIPTPSLADVSSIELKKISPTLPTAAKSGRLTAFVRMKNSTRGIDFPTAAEL